LKKGLKGAVVRELGKVGSEFAPLLPRNVGVVRAKRSPKQEGIGRLFIET